MSFPSLCFFRKEGFVGVVSSTHKPGHVDNYKKTPGRQSRFFKANKNLIKICSVIRMKAVWSQPPPPWWPPWCVPGFRFLVELVERPRVVVPSEGKLGAHPLQRVILGLVTVDLRHELWGS